MFSDRRNGHYKRLEVDRVSRYAETHAGLLLFARRPLIRSVCASSKSLLYEKESACFVRTRQGTKLEKFIQP